MQRFRVSLLAVVPFVAVLVGFGEPKHSKVDVKIGATKDKSVEVEFKVVAATGKHVTDEGPWDLTLTNTNGLELAAPAKDGKVQIKAYDGKIPGFRLAGKPAVKDGKGEFTYALKAFICEDDKTACYAEIHKGTVKWAAP